jgi:hypothetical protein
MKNWPNNLGLNNAVGTTVCREFGSDGVFYGVITAFRSGKGNGEDLYQVEYNDGDVEDMDGEEYNYAYALYLREEGWNVEEAEADTTASASNRKQKKKARITKAPTPCSKPMKKKTKATAAEIKIAKLQEVVDLTAKSTIAGKHIYQMDAVGKDAVVSLLGKTAKKNENKIVKDAVVAVAYAGACKKAFVEHLKNCQRTEKQVR